MPVSCPNRLENGQECGDEGRLCEACAEQEMRDHAYLANVSKYAVMPIDDGYYQELRDAGRFV
jgi:hypothetical protein